MSLWRDCTHHIEGSSHDAAWTKLVAWIDVENEDAATCELVRSSDNGVRNARSTEWTRLGTGGPVRG